jgi:hypothetical protein
MCINQHVLVPRLLSVGNSNPDAKVNACTVGENDKERRRLSNEAGKPVPPKPAPKEKPHVPGRPTVPTRPSSISRGRGNSQKEEAEKRKSLDAEKRKSVEPETVPEAKK